MRIVEWEGTMKPIQWFCLVIQIVGLWSLMTAAGYFTTFFTTLRGFFHSEATPPAYLIQGFVHLGISLMLLRNTPYYANLAYPDKDTSLKDNMDEIVEG